MPQQINLCTPILLKPKRYFSAQTMAVSLAVFVVLGGVLCAAWVWNLKSAGAGFSLTMALQTREIDSLKSAIQRSKANAAPADAALVQQLQDQRKTVEQRAQLLVALRSGLLPAGEGHSDRLQLVARSIPANVWVTGIKTDQGRFEVTGFTLDPAALNEWVEKMATSPLMRGLKLGTVKVENTTLPAASAPASATRPTWSFSLVSMEPKP